MVKNYQEYKYFENRPDVVKIFDDLDEFLEWCKEEGEIYNEAFLYNRESAEWRGFDKWRRAKKSGTVERKPYLGKNPRFKRTE